MGKNILSVHFPILKSLTMEPLEALLNMSPAFVCLKFKGTQPCTSALAIAIQVTLTNLPHFLDTWQIILPSATIKAKHLFTWNVLPFWRCCCWRWETWICSHPHSCDQSDRIERLTVIERYSCRMKVWKWKGFFFFAKRSGEGDTQWTIITG